MKKILYFMPVISIAFFCSSFSNAYAADQIPGFYHCTGYDPFAKLEYSGKVTVTKSDDTYQLIWDCGVSKKGKSMRYHGTGIRDAKSGTLAVAFADFNAHVIGIINYSLDKKDELNGTWTTLNKHEVGTEICKKLPIVSPSGTQQSQ